MMMAGVSSRTRSKNVSLLGVSSRTRSKNAPLFGCIPLIGSSKRRMKKGLDSVSGSKKRKVNDEPFVVPKNAEVIFMDENEEGSEKYDEKEVKSDESGEKDEKEVQEEPLVVPQNAKVISTEDDDDGDKDEERSVQCEREGCVDVEKEVMSEESDEIDAKDGNIVDDEEEEQEQENDDDESESEENETSDEDFRVDELNEISDNDDDSSSDDKKKKGYRKDEFEHAGHASVSSSKLKEVSETLKAKSVEVKVKNVSDESVNVGVNAKSKDNVGDSDVGKDQYVKGLDVGGVSLENDSIVLEFKDNGVDRQDTQSPPVFAETTPLIWSLKKVEKVQKTKEIEDDGNDENESSDEDFRVDEVNVISDNDEEEEQEDLKKIWEECSNALEEMVREVEDKKRGISKRNNEEVNIDNSPSCVNNDVSKHADHSSLTTFEMGYFDPMKDYSSFPFPNLNEASKKCKPKSVNIKMQNVSNEDDVQVIADQPISFGHSKAQKGETNNANAKANAEAKANKNVNVGDSDEGKQQYVKGLGIGSVSPSQVKLEKMRDSDKPKMKENKGRDSKGGFRIRNGEKRETMDNNGLNQRVKSSLFMPKELHLAKLFAECYWENKNDTIKNDSIVWEVSDNGVDGRDTRPPPVSVETPQQIWSLKKVEKVQKTKEEEEQEPLWDQMDIALREFDAVSLIGNLGTNEAKEENMGNPSPRCEHDTRLDEEIGVYCRLCGVVITEIKYISQLVMDRFPNENSGKRASFDDSENVSLFDGSQFKVSDDESMPNFSLNEGTVWDLIPGVKQTLYPHQQEGFEFIWKNLAGNINLHKLKNNDPRREGGCIISHAPGTGKTRLTIMFLMAYLKVFPKCMPVIVAPASLLLTWEDEFKKWDIGVPFHNLNNLKLSGKEHDDAVSFVSWSNKRLGKDTTRMVKLISWYKEKSILGISYNLYEKLAGEGRKKKKHANVEKRKENGEMRNALLEAPGLLVLDEGHIPRNERSLIWNVLSKIQTRKRIILSGTPFQNNFLELYNILSLVKPSFPNTIPHELKKFCQKQEYKKASEEWSWEAVSGNSTCNPSDDKIKKLKLLMDPFVHVHKGAILQKKLPGIRDCKLTLKPDNLQKQILDSIQSSQNALIFERKLTMASIHPSLFLECELLKEEEYGLDKDRLEKLRLNPYIGVKTKFLVEFVRLCDAVNEKVLVFSQLIRPLRLIIDQLLNTSLKWTVGKEILYMHGEVGLKDRQSLIHSFNDANSKAKILLASTNACSEGISLVGASRVVLLDVVWNPSVDRQAISRAYRIGQKKVVYTYHLLTEGTAEKIKHRKQAENGNATSGVGVPPSSSWFCSCWIWNLCHNNTYPVTSTTELVSPNRRRNVKKVRCQRKASSFSSSCEGRRQGFDFDPELRSVLELANDSELSEIQTILFGPSYLSPLLKSITSSSSSNMNPSMIGHDIQLRQQFIETLESRFFFLAADARSTLRGWRPSYRNVLLHLTSKLNIPCSTQLHTHHLELEIFLHLLHINSSNDESPLLDVSAPSDSEGTLQLGLNQWKMHSELGAQHFQSIIFKGGGIFTLAKIYQLLARKLSGKMLVEAANYQVKKELLKKGGQVALINLESRAALLAAKQGFLGAASRYLGFRSMLTLLGPVLWGTFLADLVIQMLGTDYARILRTVYALAQIRVIRTYRLPSDIAEE